MPFHLLPEGLATDAQVGGGGGHAKAVLDQGTENEAALTGLGLIS